MFLSILQLPTGWLLGCLIFVTDDRRNSQTALVRPFTMGAPWLLGCCVACGCTTVRCFRCLLFFLEKTAGRRWRRRMFPFVCTLCATGLLVRELHYCRNVYNRYR